MEEDICLCGHREEEHHISWFPGGGKLVEECEYYDGYNETGGMKYVDGKWVEHCQFFRSGKVSKPTHEGK